ADQRDAASNWLIQNIEANGWRLKTGFLGVSYLNPALTDTGHNDIAYRLLEQEEYPSWLYPVLQGATTIWERWNSYTLASGFGPVGMNSFNHYSYGSIMEWVYKDMLGIERDEENPGYKHFVLQPTYGGTLTYAKGSYDSVYGTIVSDWTLENDEVFVYNATVPANTTATLYLPAAEGAAITESGVNVAEAQGVTFVKMENGTAVYELESGSYSFRSPVKVSRTTAISVSAEDSAVPVKVTVNGEEFVLPTTLYVEAGQELTLEAAPLNNVDYQVASWKDADGNVTKGATLTVTPAGKTEFTVATEWIGLENIAVGAKVTAQQVNASWSAANLTDGILSYHGGTNGWSSPSQGNNVTTFNEVSAVLDLGEAKEFNRFHIYPRNLPTELEDVGVMNCPTAYKFYISDDNANWTEVYSTADGPVTNGFAPIVIELDETVSARYVKFGCTAINHPDEHETAYVQLSELGIYKVEDAPPIPEITVSATDATGAATTSAMRDELFNVTVNAPADAVNVRLVNEYGLAIGRKEYKVTDNGDGTKTFTFKASIGTVGSGRKLTVSVQDADGAYTPTDAVLIMDILPKIPTIASASIEETAMANKPVSLKVVTDRYAAKIVVTNEYGLKMGTLSQAYEDVDGERIWTVQMKIGTAGTRCFKVQAKNSSGDLSEAVTTNMVTVGWIG
ncbi:MAG: hypothetical protein HFE85_02450, partial [Clostridiales bacterium]|nr:hypothetical protein [Clostridiales bacterium]